MVRMIALIFCALLATASWAVEPDEILDDPVLEQRARLISKGLRCLQCRNESIADSSADIAKDLRLLVRERLLRGDTDTEVVTYIVERYGEFVLLSPRTTGINLVLWLAGPVLFLCVIAILLVPRRKNASADVDPLTKSEETKLKMLLNETND